MSSLMHSRRIRWLTPVLVIAVIGLLAFVPTISAGADTPTLPALTPQDLLKKVQAAKVSALPGLSGTIKVSANLGIPSLGALGGVAGGDGSFNPTDLLSGAHSADVWASKDGFKATYSDSLTSEDDVIANHTDLWTWQSRGTKVTHVVLPADTAKPAEPATPEASSPVKTPDQVAQALLDKLAPSSVVTVSSPVYVANDRAAYQLVLTPNPDVAANAASTVDHITFAVDDATGLPIQVQIFPRTAPTTAAFDFGFSKLNIGPQSSNMFNFSPPSGATVTTKVLSSGDHSAQPQTTEPPSTTTKPGPSVVGHDWTTVYVFHQAQVPAQVSDALARVADKSGLVSTTLFNVLRLNNGDVAVGAVNAGALQQAATAPAG